MEEDLISPEWLFRELRSHDGLGKLLILDCRAHSDFSEAHVRGSVPLAIPSIMLRRLAAGKVDLLSTIRCLDLRNRVEVFLCGDENSRGTFVLIGDSTDPAGHQGETIQVLSRRLRSGGGCVATLMGERGGVSISAPAPFLVITSVMARLTPLFLQVVSERSEIDTPNGASAAKWVETALPVKIPTMAN